MKSQLVNLRQLSGSRTTIYSVAATTFPALPGSGQACLFDQFIKEHQAGYLTDLMNIAGRLKSIGNMTGAALHFFKTDEGLGWNDKVCALYDIPEKHLRLYCIRFSEKIIVVGNGGPKSVRTWQEDARLTRAVHEMMHYSSIIQAGLRSGGLSISLNGMRFEGNLQLTHSS